MKILSLDPGYDRCGIACIEKEQGKKEVLLNSQCIVTNKGEVFEERLHSVVSIFREWIEKYKPDVCALETLFFATNQKTAMRVAETRGALLYVATHLSIPVHEFTPKQVKIAVTGDGSASKNQVMLMVPKLLSVEKDIKHDDEYDAIAVGLTASATLSSSYNFST